MRGRSLKTITVTLSAFAFAVACTPDGEPPVLNATAGAQADHVRR